MSIKKEENEKKGKKKKEIKEGKKRRTVACKNFLFAEKRFFVAMENVKALSISMVAEQTKGGEGVGGGGGEKGGGRVCVCVCAWVCRGGGGGGGHGGGSLCGRNQNEKQIH